MAEVQSSAPGYSRIVSGAVLEVFWHLARATEGIAPPSVDRQGGPASPGFAREAQDYLVLHHAEALSIDEVARRFHLSRQYFSKLFRRLVGQSPHSFLTEVRLAQARMLLDETRLSVQAIATRVGFPDPYYFTRVFRSHTGLTPTQFRDREQ